ncbi:MAG: M18 family aminopeptidase, partial [Muribaculaceae bacterium]|nr:M18 family aminopeptidase [Muribaculaceae bacterium]
TRVAAVFDNEETGSTTRQGAAAPTLRHILERVTLGLERGAQENRESFYRALEHTFLISADDAHAWHPNYGDKYDPTVHALIGHGPVVKINSNCKYMTDPRGAAVFRALCDKVDVQCQYFVNHGDVAGGSTLGNILTSQLDIAGVDMGCAIWAMHSAAETGSMSDLDETVKVFREFYRS